MSFIQKERLLSKKPNPRKANTLCRGGGGHLRLLTPNRSGLTPVWEGLAYGQPTAGRTYYKTPWVRRHSGQQPPAGAILSYNTLPAFKTGAVQMRTISAENITNSLPEELACRENHTGYVISFL